jgi:hypothetical protein
LKADKPDSAADQLKRRRPPPPVLVQPQVPAALQAQANSSHRLVVKRETRAIFRPDSSAANSKTVAMW